MQWVYGNSWLAVPECVGILQVPVRIADHHIANKNVGKVALFSWTITPPWEEMASTWMSAPIVTSRVVATARRNRMSRSLLAFPTTRVANLLHAVAVIAVGRLSHASMPGHLQHL